MNLSLASSPGLPLLALPLGKKNYSLIIPLFFLRGGARRGRPGDEAISLLLVLVLSVVQKCPYFRGSNKYAILALNKSFHSYGGPN